MVHLEYFTLEEISRKFIGNGNGQNSVRDFPNLKKKTWLLKEVSGNIQQVASVFFTNLLFSRIFFYAKATQEYTITVRPKQEVRKVMDYQIYSDTLDQVCGQGTKITTKIHLSAYSSAASSRIATF